MTHSSDPIFISKISKGQNFIHLKDVTFAEYNFIYHINDGYSPKQLSGIYGKHQLLFQKMSSKVQQMNLMIIDSVFPILLADVVLETFLNKVSSLHKYVQIEKNFTVVSTKLDKIYFENKFKFFINQLLYSNIATEQVCKGDIVRDYVYYFKPNDDEIQYFSFYEQHELQTLLLEKLKLEINLSQSSISKSEVNLNFKICFHN